MHGIIECLFSGTLHKQQTHGTHWSCNSMALSMHLLGVVSNKHRDFEIFPGPTFWCYFGGNHNTRLLSSVLNAVISLKWCWNLVQHPFLWSRRLSAGGIDSTRQARISNYFINSEPSLMHFKQWDQPLVCALIFSRAGLYIACTCVSCIRYNMYI